MWDAIKSRNMGAEHVKDARLHTLIREFDDFMMKETGTIDEYASRITAISSKAATLGQPLQLSRGHGKGSNRGHGNGGGSGPGNQNRGSQGGSNEGDKRKGKKDYSEVQCFRCDEFGHFVSRCPERRKEREAHLAEVKEKDPSIYMVQYVPEKVYLNEQKVIPKDYKGGSDEQDLWYLDNGASNHMTGNLSFFSELNKRVGSKVKFGDGSYVDICRKGSILLVGKTGEQQLLTDIFYIPSLQSNIISLGQAIGSGCDIRMKDDYLMYDDQGKLLMRVSRSKNRLYTIKLKRGKPVCLQAQIDKENWLWHVRLGHLNFESMKQMVKNNMIVEMPKVDQKNQICDSCLVGMQTRKPFPKSATFRATQALELIHGDLCGPITPSTIAGNRSSPGSNSTSSSGDGGEEDNEEPIVENAPTSLDDLLFLANDELVCFDDVKSKPEWVKAMHGSLNKHKARLVAKGYVQQPGVNFDEVFAPVARLETVRLLLSLAANGGWELHHLDVKSAFLHGELKEEVFVTQPLGFVKKGEEHKVYKLSKALYGLRQAPRAWNTKPNGILLNMKFHRCIEEQAVYRKKIGADLLIVGVYVDDLIVTGSNLNLIMKFKREMPLNFKMSDWES
ncbi:uncharacterized protein LOC143560552 [Bidens hawaiensis]|uniref:uncharacterized protein LOC143560552 n=1 Tax=Bidens hawaiensis TaxID=980011 RepID=UPI00404B31C6